MINYVNGTASFTTQGTSQGVADDFIRRLDGALTFELVDGRMGEVGLFKFISETTKIDVFDEMVFTSFEGDITLQRAIMLRNPYVDPMSLMQVDLLKRWRETNCEDQELLDTLLASVIGIAQGLQNTG